MGLELLVIHLDVSETPLGIVAIAAVLLGRYVSVMVPIGLMRSGYGFIKGTGMLLTWGGLRGGISIAMALSIPQGPYKDLILGMTYVTVVFSVLVQGTTFGAATKAIIVKNEGAN
jgi:CPA1 family monovalent cation:H+ antiporter